MKRWQLSAFFTLCALGFGPDAMANLSFRGTLVEPPPCTISSGSTIDINFNYVGINAVDGVNYRQPLSYTINCAASPLPWRMMLTVQGTATTFDPAAVQTSAADMGVRLLRDGVAFTLNTPISINPSSPPVLQAVPVKRLGGSLASGGFTASATLLAYYE